ncbi:MAG: peptidase M23, partial [Bacteroidota bacterium]
MANKGHYLIVIVLIAFTGVQFTFAQTGEQRALEAKRAKLQNEIKEINRLLFAERKQEGSVLEQMEGLDKRINVRQELIRVTNQQSN